MLLVLWSSPNLTPIKYRCLSVSSLASSHCYYCQKRNSHDKMVLMQLKGWYSKLQRDEVVAEWKRVQGKMSLHVHCHISGGNFLHNIIANLRFYIFRKELPVVSPSPIKLWHHYVQQLCLCLWGHTRDSSVLSVVLYMRHPNFALPFSHVDLVFHHRCWRPLGMAMKNFWRHIQVRTYSAIDVTL